MAQSAQPIRILVVDDEEAMRDSCSQVLTKDGYEVHVASDGTTGLELAKELKPNLVLVDLKMPGIGGQEVLERIRNLDASIALVVITGYATVGSATEAMNHGALDFLPKPFTPAELRNVVQRAIERSELMTRATLEKDGKDDQHHYLASMLEHEVLVPLAELKKQLEIISVELPNPISHSLRSAVADSRRRVDQLMILMEKWRQLM